MGIVGKLLGGLFVLIILNNAVALSQIPEGWEIREIAPAGTEYFYDSPDINNRGQIVFHRRLWPSLPEIEIMLYDRGRLVQLTEDHIRDVIPRLNNHGVVVWSRDLREDGLLSVVRWQGGQLDVISEEGHVDIDAGADINDAGVIVWDRSPPRPPDHTQVFFFDGTQVRQLTNDLFSNQGPRINQRGDVVYTQYNFSQSNYSVNVAGYLNGTFWQLTTGTNPRYFSDINDNTEILWAGPYTGLELWRNGQTTRLLQEGVGGTINNRGDIATAPWDEESQRYILGIFRDGQFLFITDEFAGFWQINGRGEVVFQTGEFPSIGVSLFTKENFRADVDFDGDVDLNDAAVMQRCFGSEGDSIDEACWSSDTNADEEVSLQDFKSIAELLEGPK